MDGQILAPVEDPFADSPDEGLPPLNSRRGPDTASCNKPSRRAQIFDKGVDASMMEVYLTCDSKVFLMQRCLLVQILRRTADSEVAGCDATEVV